MKNLTHFYISMCYFGHHVPSKHTL